MNLFENLAFFARIIEIGGVAAAGREFGFSAATASDRLSALEKHYGVPLLNRTTRAISLTDEGRMLIDSARHLIADARDIELRIKDGKDKLSGRIRLSTTIDFGSEYVAPLVEQFIEMHPDISIELILDDKHTDLVSNGIDLALRFGMLSDSGLIIRKIGPNYRSIVASPAYLEREGIPTHPDDLLQHNCLIIRLHRSTDKAWEFTIDGQRRILRVSGNYICNNGRQIREWCLAGRGIARKSIWDTGKDIAHGRLVPLLENHRAGEASALQVVYPAGPAQPQRVKRFIDYLAENLIPPIPV